MSRDPTRIYAVMKKLHFLWAQHPELRLGQLVGQLTRDGALFYIEDDELCRRMDDFPDWGTK